jgi:hypothetical protein
VVVEYHGRGIAPDVPTTTKTWPCRLQPSAMCACRLPVISISIDIGIGIGILLHRAMNVGLVLWLGMAHVVGRGFDVPTARHDRAGFSADFDHMRLQVRPPGMYY